MARIFPFLWPVGLILCCCWSQANSTVRIKLTGDVPKASRTPVELKCETSKMDVGMFWVRQNLDLSTRFILYIPSRSKSGQVTANGCTGSKASDFYLLKITSFGEEYEGIYYCFLIHNQVVHLSSGLKVYLPKATTIAPQVSTPSEGLTTTMGCPHSTASDPDPDDNVMFPCELYIWAPLAGGCFLLLVMLVITLSVCCDPRRRRRRCRCKRPLNGTNGTVTMSRLIN